MRYLHRTDTKSFGESYMKKFKLNVQRHICILLCLILYITVLPLPVSAEEAKSKTVRVGWYEGIPQKQTVRGEATATNTSRQ